VHTTYDPGSFLRQCLLGLYLYGTALPLMIERVLLDSTGDQAISTRERAKRLYDLKISLATDLVSAVIQTTSSGQPEQAVWVTVDS
jgi:hypothetical protein